MTLGHTLESTMKTATDTIRAMSTDDAKTMTQDELLALVEAAVAEDQARRAAVASSWTTDEDPNDPNPGHDGIY